jgi:hypothetical protein
LVKRTFITIIFFKVFKSIGEMSLFGYSLATF